MTPKQIEALKALALTLVALLVTLGLLTADVAGSVVGVVAAAFVVVAAFFANPRK